MVGLSYILDTNVVAHYLNDTMPTKTRIDDALQQRNRVYLCQPVHYEVLRGLLKANAIRKLRAFQEIFMPQLIWLALEDEDWQQAAVFWSDTRKRGRQLSDTDLLIAALTLRIGGILVTADNDFEALPIPREN